MTIYFEDTFIENFFVTYLILHIVFLFIQEKSNIPRRIFSSFVGGGFALLYPIISLSGILLFSLKILLGYIITIVAYKTNSLKRQLFFFCMFLIVTAIYGGVSLMIHFSVYGDFLGHQKLPSILIVGLLLITTYFLKQVISRIYQKTKLNSFVYKITITNGKIKVKTNGYLDTGNLLCDSNNCPISLINYKLFSQLNNSFDIKDLLQQNIGKLKNGRYIKVKTLTGFDSVLVFNVDSLEVFDGKDKYFIDSPSFALSKVKITELGCDVVLNPRQIKGV